MSDWRRRWTATALLFCGLGSAGSLFAQGSYTGFQPLGDVVHIGKPTTDTWAGRVTQVVPVSTSLIFAATEHGGIWKTADGGTSWQPLIDDAGSMRVGALAVDAAGMRVFATTRFNLRLLRSTDGGSTFAELEIELLDGACGRVTSLLLDPRNATTIYALSPLGLLRSQSNGDEGSWVNVFPANGADVDDAELLWDGVSAFRVLLTQSGELWKSTSGDAGSYSQIAIPTPGDGMPAWVNADRLLLAPVPAQPSDVYVAYGEEDGGIYHSDSLGDAPTWTGRHQRELSPWNFVASGDGTTLYDGEVSVQGSPGNAQLNVYTFDEFDQEWDHSTVAQAAGYHSDIRGLAVTPLGPYVYMGTDGGLFRYLESNGTVENLTGDMDNLMIRGLHVSRGSHVSVAAGTQDNGPIVFRGHQWQYMKYLSDAADTFLTRDNPNLGGAFETISGERLLWLNGDVATSGGTQFSLCQKPTRGLFFADPADSTRVCTANGIDPARCAGNNGRGSWCVEKSLGKVPKALAVVDTNHVWAIVALGDVYRSETGVGGPWLPSTANLPPGGALFIDAPERGDPWRALVLAGSPPQVWETTDENASWLERGNPPFADPGDPQCLGGSAAERDPAITGFGVRFDGGVLWNEVWFVATKAGLRASTDLGQTWVDTDVPHAEIKDLDTYSGVVTVGTFGRGVFQQVVENPFDEVPVDYDPFWWLRHSPVEDTNPWASDIVARSVDLIEEIRLVGDGGRVFRRGDTAFGAHDFTVAPGSPFLVRADAAGSYLATGPDAAPREIRLAPGWNPIGILDDSLAQASELISDAAQQGVVLAAVVNGDGIEGIMDAGARGPVGDFALEESGGVWVYACDEALWTPGAGGVTPSQASPNGGESQRGAAGSCPGLADALGAVPEQLHSRLPAQVLACVPSQTVDVGADTITICAEGTPSVNDRDPASLACAEEADGRGCAIVMQVIDVTESQPDELSIGFDFVVSGDAVLADGSTCRFDGAATDRQLLTQVSTTVDTPAIDLFADSSLLQGNAPSLDGCGDAVGSAAATVIWGAVEQALGNEIALRLSGLGPVCAPSFPLPDADGDGFFDVCGHDCNDGDPEIWARPGEVLQLKLTRDAAGTTVLNWAPPTEPGASAWAYDVLELPSPDSLALASCLSSADPTATTAFSPGIPVAGEIHAFLVRATNPCPAGDGTLGYGQGGVERSGPACP